MLVACFARGSRRKMDLFALVREQQVAFLLAWAPCLWTMLEWAPEQTL